MRIVHQRCCALDVHKKSITACVLVWDGKQLVEERKKEFGTTKKQLGRLRFWLLACKVTEVAMESAGVYWKPVWNVLEKQNQFRLKLGLDMKVFFTPERAASWSGLCPGNRKSAGKPGHGRTRKGNRWIRRGLTQSALAASHAEDTYLRSFYWRISSKRGPRKPGSRRHISN